MTKSKSQYYTIAWSVFLVGMLYYCFAYLLRVYPNIMKDQLFGHFGIASSGFGLLTAVYYFAYAPMQLPVGVSVDKIGPRRSLIGACLISTVGALIFSMTADYYIALFGRFLIGLGAAFAYVTALKLATIWLPRKYFATATGAVTGFGMIAAMFTEVKFTQLVQTEGFQSALNFPVYAGCAILVLILLFIRDKPKVAIEGIQQLEDASALSYHQLKEYLKLIMKSRQMWYIGIIGALLYMPSSVFLDVWAIPYLETAHGFTAVQAAYGVTIMLFGWIFSSIATGAISDVVGNRKIFLVVAAFISFSLSLVLLYVDNLSIITVFTLLFLFGVSCGPHPLCFTLSKESNPQKISGTAVAFANFIIMMGGFIFQPVVGKLLDMFWAGTLHNGIRVYSPHNYTLSLTLIPAGLFIALLLSLRIKDTYHTAVDKHS